MPVWKETMEEAARIGYEFTDFPKPVEVFPGETLPKYRPVGLSRL